MGPPTSPDTLASTTTTSNPAPLSLQNTDRFSGSIESVVGGVNLVRVSRKSKQVSFKEHQQLVFVVDADDVVTVGPQCAHASF